jgi:hypothetical protein
VRNLGLAIAKRHAAFAGTAASFVDESRERVSRVLGIRDRALSPPGRRAFEQLAPLIGTISDLRRWSPEERAGLREIIVAKAGPREHEYLRLLARHGKFREALLRLGTSRR